MEGIQSVDGYPKKVPGAAKSSAVSGLTTNKVPPVYDQPAEGEGCRLLINVSDDAVRESNSYGRPQRRGRVAPPACYAIFAADISSP